MNTIEILKNAIDLKDKDTYTEQEYFDALEAAYSWLYGACKAYGPDDSAALSEVAKNGGSLADLDNSLKCMIDEFILWCEEFVEDGLNVGIQSCFDDIENRAWWVALLFRRYRMMIEE